MFFVNKDVNEKSKNDFKLWSYFCSCNRGKKNNYSKKITHGETVLSGMILAIKLSIFKKSVI